MPIDSTVVIIAIELLLMISGCFLLWKHWLSKSASQRALEAKETLPAWDLNLTSFLLFIWVIFCGGLLGQSLLSIFIDRETISTASMTVVAGASFHGGMLLGIFVFKYFFDRFPALPAKRLTLTHKLLFGGATVLIALPTLALVGLLWQNILRAMGIVIEQQDLIGIFADEESPLLLILMTFLAITLAPMTEELIFRGGIFRYMRTRTPRWVALFVPAILFGALHGNLASFAPLVVLGVILSLAYERSGSIIVPIVAHGLFNLNTIIMILGGVN